MKKWLSSIFQHGLTSVGAILVAAGIVDAEAVDAFISANAAVLSGLVMYLIGQGWDLLTKKDKKDKE